MGEGLEPPRPCGPARFQGGFLGRPDAHRGICWRRERDSNPRTTCAVSCFRGRCLAARLPLRVVCWLPREDSDLEPPGSEPGALPVELRGNMAALPGIGPGPRGSKPRVMPLHHRAMACRGVARCGGACTRHVARLRPWGFAAAGLARYHNSIERSLAGRPRFERGNPALEAGGLPLSLSTRRCHCGSGRGSRTLGFRGMDPAFFR